MHCRDEHRGPLPVEAVAWLVEQDEIRLLDEGHRQTHALTLSHRETVHAVLGELRQREAPDRLLDGRGPALDGHEGDTSRVVQLPAHREARIQAGAGGGEERQALLVGAPVAVGVQPERVDVAVGRADQAGEDAQQRGLAHPVGAPYPGQCARLERQLEVVDDLPARLAAPHLG